MKHLSNISRDNEAVALASNSTSSDFIDLCKSRGGDNLFGGTDQGRLRGRDEGGGVEEEQEEEEDEKEELGHGGA